MVLKGEVVVRQGSVNGVIGGGSDQTGSVNGVKEGGSGQIRVG